MRAWLAAETAAATTIRWPARGQRRAEHRADPPGADDADAEGARHCAHVLIQS